MLTLLALLLSVATGYLNTHTDEVLVVLPWVLLATSVFGVAAPRGVWHGALLIGLAVPASQIVAVLLHLHVPYPNTPRDIGDSCVTLIPALIGVAAGAALRWSVRHSVTMPPPRHSTGKASDR